MHMSVIKAYSIFLYLQLHTSQKLITVNLNHYLFLKNIKKELRLCLLAAWLPR